MTKQELVYYIADNAGLSKKDAGAALSSFVEGVKKSLKKGDSTTLVGFGTFSVSKRSARQGRNPQTGTTISIPARNVPLFKASRALKAITLDVDSGIDDISMEKEEAESASHGDENGVDD